ncbi:MAG: hypothetical protein L0H59_14750, partial [Tomitella sp.]|nr:hypothetical protein [Tomitella sp.]
MRLMRRQSRTDPGYEGFIADPNRSRSLFSRQRWGRSRGATQNTNAGAREQGRIAVLEAVLWAIEHRGALAELAYQCADRKELDQQLAHKYGFDAEQCNVVNSVSVQRMTRASRSALREELDALSACVHSETPAPRRDPQTSRDRLAFVLATAINEVEHHWSFMANEEPHMLGSWVDGDHLLFVYRPYPETHPVSVYGLDYRVDFTGPSPTRFTDLTDTELAHEIARYQ